MKKIVNLPKKGQKGFRSIPIEKRLWSKINKTESCWEWTAFLNEDGYGSIKYKGMMRRAHRVMYEIFVHPIPKGMYVLHHCDNPRCVNPAHLFLGTQGDNVRDMLIKERGKNQKRGRKG